MTTKTLRTAKHYPHAGLTNRVDIDIVNGYVTLNIDQIDDATGFITDLYFTAHYTPVVTDVAGFVKRLDVVMSEHRDDLLALFRGGEKWSVLLGMNEDGLDADDIDPCSEPSDSQVFTSVCPY